VLRTVVAADRETEETERKELEMQRSSSQRKTLMSERTKKDEEEHQKTSVTITSYYHCRPSLPGKQQPSSTELQSIFSKWKEQQQPQQQQQHTGDDITGSAVALLLLGPCKNQ